MNIMFIENDYTLRPQRLKSNVFLKSNLYGMHSNKRLKCLFYTLRQTVNISEF